MNALKKFSMLLMACFLTIGLFGQKPIVLEEDTINFTHGDYIGLRLTIPEVNYEDVSKGWTKILEKGTRSNIQIENGEITIFGASIKDVYPEPINLYSLISSIDSAILLEVTFELKPKEYLAKQTTPSEYTQARILLFSFAKDLYSDLAKQEFKEQEKALSKLERDMESLRNEKERLEKSIVNDNADIEEYNGKIALLRQEAENLNDQLVRERALLNELDDEQARLSKEAEIKEIEKNKEKALKEAESLEKKILLRKSGIQRAELDIDTNIQEQAATVTALEEQQAITAKAEQKYNTILNY